MSRPPAPNHSFSFEPNDETTLSSQRQNQQSYQPYRDDSPARNVASPPPGYHYDAYQPSTAPAPPLHREHTDPFADHHKVETDRADALGYTNSMRSASTTTPGVDNLGEAAVGGGIAGIAMGIAGHNERESGLQAMRGMEESNPGRYDQNPYVSEPHARAVQHSYGAAGAGAGADAGAWASQHPDETGMPLDHYPAQPVNADSPYKRYSAPFTQDDFDPNDIEDDGDDGLMRPGQRRSVLGLGGSSNNNLMAGAAGGGAAGAAYNALGRAGSGGANGEKSGYAAAEARRKKKRILFIVLGILSVVAIITGAILGGVLGVRKSSSSAGGQSAKEDDKTDLDKNSAEIKALMNNADLHKVFPGVDYTPFNAQYPACIDNPPSQNNVTRDIAVLSQLTNVVRLYGTDCNQTDMVLHSMDKLGITDMKVWLGVWLDNNQTTNTRGMAAMYDILDRQGTDKFAGVIIGNEVLFRKDMTPTELAKVVSGVKSNFTSKNINLDIGVADLGDNWQKDGSSFINSVDVVMSNIHPFFGGVEATAAAGWTWDFWQTNDLALTKGTSKKNVISEVGWPSEGGNDCGDGANCQSKTAGAVAGISEMNTFMDSFVCQSMTNATTYFWFEAFDEPWKVQFNNGSAQWEDRWGLMTPDRKLKPGVIIPDCGGKTSS